MSQDHAAENAIIGGVFVLIFAVALRATVRVGRDWLRLTPAPSRRLALGFFLICVIATGVAGYVGVTTLIIAFVTGPLPTLRPVSLLVAILVSIIPPAVDRVYDLVAESMGTRRE